MQLSLSEAVAKLRELLREIRQEPWVFSEMVPEAGAYTSHEEIVEALRKMISLSKNLRFWGVSLDPDEISKTLWDHLRIEDSALWVCHTGNGPTSQKHAEFIAHVKEWLPGILDALEEAQREREEAQRERDNLLDATKRLDRIEELSRRLWIDTEPQEERGPPGSVGPPGPGDPNYEKWTPLHGVLGGIEITLSEIARHSANQKEFLDKAQEQVKRVEQYRLQCGWFREEPSTGGLFNALHGTEPVPECKHPGNKVYHQSEDRAWCSLCGAIGHTRRRSTDDEDEFEEEWRWEAPEGR